MSIKASVIDMEAEIIGTTNMLWQTAVIEFIEDLAIRIMNVDAITFEYAITDGNETFRCYNRNMFVKLLETVL